MGLGVFAAGDLVKVNMFGGEGGEGERGKGPKSQVCWGCYTVSVEVKRGKERKGEEEGMEKKGSNGSFGCGCGA